jgi:pheromone a factor receptor
MRHPTCVVFSFIALFAVCLPLPWHWRARNIATLAVIFWLFLANAVIFTNGIIWSDNYVDHSPLWCDICELLLGVAVISMTADVLF